MGEPAKPTIHYDSYGSGEPTVVLTHGIAASANTWRFQIGALEKVCRTVAWDLRGHGKSASPPGPYGIPDLARDMLRIADQLGAEKIVPLGHSAGGAVSMRFALDYPERTKGLVLLAGIAEEHGMEKVIKQLGLSREAQNLDKADPQGCAHVTRAMAGLYENPMTDRIHEIQCPTLIIVGEKDFLGAGGSVIMSRKIPNAQLEIVPDRLEDPEDFNRRVIDFLETLR